MYLKNSYKVVYFIFGISRMWCLNANCVILTSEKALKLDRPKFDFLVLLLYNSYNNSSNNRIIIIHTNKANIH